MSNTEFIRHIAAFGTKQRFYEALRLNEAADELAALEAEAADLHAAVAAVVEFLHANVEALDPILQADADRAAFMLQALRAVIERPEAARTQQVEGEVVTLKGEVLAENPRFLDRLAADADKAGWELRFEGDDRSP
jgi:hypothetical protein